MLQVEQKNVERLTLLSHHQDVVAIRRDRDRHLPVRLVARDVARGSATVNGHAVDVLKSGPSRREKDLTAVRRPDHRNHDIARRQSAPKLAPKLVQPKIPSSVFLYDDRELCAIWR